jgi:hypothetical protein
MYAARIAGIYAQTADIDLFTANKAVAVIARLDAAQGGLDPEQLLLASPLGCLSHLLRLQASIRESLPTLA